jgi:hypothetical protein
VRIALAHCSRLHTELRVDQNQKVSFVNHSKAASATSLNGQPLAPEEAEDVRDGDVFEICGKWFRFEASVPASTTKMSVPRMDDYESLSARRAWYEREHEDRDDVESVVSILASSSSRGYALPPHDSLPELHLLEQEEQIARYEELTRQIAAEKGAVLPDVSEDDDDLPLDRAARLALRFERVANLHHSLMATPGATIPPPRLPLPSRDGLVVAQRAAAPLLLAAALNRATRSAPKRRGFNALLAAALAKRAPALPAPPPDTQAVEAAVEAARAEGRAALAVVKEELASLRTERTAVPVRRLLERRALRTRRSLFVAWREAAAEDKRRIKRAADALRRGLTIMRRNVSRWHRAALRRSLDLWAERANAGYITMMLAAIQALDEGVHCYRRRVVAAAFGAWARAAARAGPTERGNPPATLENCGPRLREAFEPLEQTYHLDRDEIDDDVKAALLLMDDARAAQCVLALHSTFRHQQLAKPLDWLRARIVAETAAPAAPPRSLAAALVVPCALAFVVGLLFL